MKVGTVIYEPIIVEGFDLAFYYVKRADGTVSEPSQNMFNDITCFADARALREKPELVALSENGPATRLNRFFTLPWDFVCPTNKAYQEQILRFIDETSKKNVKGIVLNLYHFPEEGFCTCDRCQRQQKESGSNFVDWRSNVVTSFVERVKQLVKQSFALEIWPDPILAKERFGLDFEALAKYVDFFHVPLSAQNYLTMYWVDTLTRDFSRILKKPVYIELSAEISRKNETKSLLKTMAYVSRHQVEAILLLVHTAERAREICREAVQNMKFREWLDEFKFKRMNRIVEKWEETL